MSTFIFSSRRKKPPMNRPVEAPWCHFRFFLSSLPQQSAHDMHVPRSTYQTYPRLPCSRHSHKSASVPNGQRKTLGDFFTRSVAYLQRGLPVHRGFLSRDGYYSTTALQHYSTTALQHYGTTPHDREGTRGSLARATPSHRTRIPKE